MVIFDLHPLELFFFNNNIQKYISNHEEIFYCHLHCHVSCFHSNLMHTSHLPCLPWLYCWSSRIGSNSWQFKWKRLPTHAGNLFLLIGITISYLILFRYCLYIRIGVLILCKPNYSTQLSSIDLSTSIRERILFTCSSRKSSLYLASQKPFPRAT